MASLSLNTLLQLAVAQLRLGTESSLAEARSILERLLRQTPRQPNALQLLATVSRRQGDAATAEQLYRRSLDADPRQPHVWNSLGNLLLADLARPVEAVSSFERALAIQPTLVEAAYNLARALHAAGRQAAAAGAAERAMSQISGHPKERHPLAAAVLQLQALLESDAGRPQVALQRLDDALSLAPQRGALHHNRAVALAQLNRPEESLQAHEHAAALGVDDSDAHYNRGNVLQTLGRLDEAMHAYRQALRRQAAHPLAWTDLARLRWRLGHTDFDAELQQAGQQLPNDPAPALIRGHLLWRAQRLPEAAEAFSESLGRAPGAEAHDGLGRCLVRLSQQAEGLEQHARAVQLAPHVAALQANLAASLLVCHRFAEADAAARRALELAPLDQYAWALQGLAWRGLGEHHREAWLLGLPHSIACIDLPTPAGWASMEVFLVDLVAELDALHHDRRAPIDQTLRLGTQTFGDILERPSPALRALRKTLEHAIDDHLAQLPRIEGHPFLSRNGRGWRFADSWSARLEAQGHHVDHVHPHGWLSAAFYVQVPEACSNADAREGWLRFGVPEADLADVPGLGGPALHEVQPRPGRLALFPSLLWHGTSPFHSPGPRTTVSFDIVPLANS